MGGSMAEADSLKVEAERQRAKGEGQWEDHTALQQMADSYLICHWLINKIFLTVPFWRC